MPTLALAIDARKAKQGAAEFSAASRQVQTAATRAQRTLKAVAASMATVGKAARGIARQFLSLKGALITFGSGFGALRLARRAGEIEGISNAFRNLFRNLGQNPAQVMEALRRGTRSTVNDFELMKTANNALILGVAKTAEEFEELTTLARRLGAAVGRDTVDAFNDLALGIGRQSRMILDNLGITISAEQAYSKYAAAVGKSVDALTDQERRLGFLNAVLQKGREVVAGLGEDTLTLSQRLGRLGASLRNMFDRLATLLGPPILAGIEKVVDFITRNEATVLRFFATLLRVLDDIRAVLEDASLAVLEFFNVIGQGQVEKLERKLRDLNIQLRAAQKATTWNGEFLREGSFITAAEEVERVKAAIQDVNTQLERTRRLTSVAGGGGGPNILQRAATALEQRAADLERRQQSPFPGVGGAGPPLPAELTFVGPPAASEFAAFTRFKQLGQAGAKAFAAGFKLIEQTIPETITAAAGALTPHVRRVLDFGAQELGDLAFETRLLTMTNDEREKAVLLRGLEQRATAEQIGDISRLKDAYSKLIDQQQNIRRFAETVRGAFDAMGQSIGNAVADIILDFKNLEDATERLLRAIMRTLVQELVAKQIAQGISGLGQMVVKAMAPTAPAAGNPASIGNPFYAGVGGAGPPQFQRGGVFRRPSFGVFGEAGPEAVMPLARGPDGKLGVVSQGGGGRINIVMHINTPNADSFRRSEGQILGRMRGALRRGF
jgi:hypothetical protein